MKLKEIKHNHTLTDILKIFIFALIMLAPIAMIGTKCLYVICNKNAYQSYSSEYVESAINLDSSNIASLYNNGQPISFTFAEHNAQWNASFGFSDISIDLNTLFNVQTTWNKFYMYKDNQDIRFYTTSNQSYLLSAQDRTFNTFTYVVDLNVSSDTAIYEYGIANIFTFKKDKLDNVFEYSVAQLEQSPLFNWTQNTAIYSAVATMNSQLGINSQAINILLVYWFLMIVIYIIIDIVLKVYTVLTHMITRKV